MNTSDPVTAQILELQQAVQQLRRRGRERSIIFLAAAGLLVLPLVGDAEPIPHLDMTEDFSGPISGSKMQLNFANIEDRLSALESSRLNTSDTTGIFLTEGDCQSGCAVSALDLTIETHGGAVLLQLLPGAGDESASIGIQEPNAGSAGLTLVISRAPDGNPNSEPVATLTTYTTVQPIVLNLPPSAYSAIDTPPAGLWTYSVEVLTNGAAQVARVENVRLASIELAGS